MTSFDDILDKIQLYYRAVIFVVCVVVLCLFLWLFRGYGGRPEVSAKIAVVKEAAQNAERRAGEIVDWQKTKEANVKHDTADSVANASDDILPDMLKGLLSDYRNGR